MGVKDLLSWIKKTHPTALVSFPKRWAAPEVGGKRIAIDATLLTNRYHFAITDGPLRGKGALVGWYNLISLMRAHQVQPVAIWDKPGIRQWKALEARKRLTTRVIASARRQHEDERQDRLGDLKEGLTAFQELSEEEQEVVRHSLDYEVSSTTSNDILHSTVSSQIAQLRDAKVDSRSPSPYEDTTIEEKIERVTSVEDTLRTLVSRYQDSIPSPSRPQALPTVIDDNVEHIIEMEELNETLDEAARAALPDHVERSREREASRDFVDEKVGELLAEGFTETKRQNSLTLEEGRILSEMLAPRRAVEDIAVEVVALEEPLDHTIPINQSHLETEFPAPTQAIPSSDILLDDFPLPAELEPLDRLDVLIDSAPPIRDIYNRALFMPSAETHADCRELLNRLGIPILLAEAPYEAEGLATSLALEGVVDWVGSEDSDVLALGGPMLKNLSTASLPLIALPPSSLLALTTLTRPQFVDFCILLGNDACERIHGVGPVASYKYIVAHGSIESILANVPKVADRVPDQAEYMKEVNTAREVFGKLPPITEEVKADLMRVFEGMKGAEVDLEGVKGWLAERHGIRFVSPEDVSTEI